MTNLRNTATAPRVVLHAATAADLMTPNPVSISNDATVKEAAVFFVEKGFCAAPVIDEAGKPVGVVSQFDIVVHDREKVDYVSSEPAYYGVANLNSRTRQTTPRGFEVMDIDQTRVSDIMTPMVFGVAPETAADKVIENMLTHRIHRLFVIDHDGVLIGTISGTDVLKHLGVELGRAESTGPG